MSARSIDDVLGDAGRALRDPVLTSGESVGVACLLISERCSYTEAMEALARFRKWLPNYDPPQADQMLCQLWAHLGCARAERRSALVLRSAHKEGTLSNVIKAHFRQRGLKYAATVLAESEIRDEIAACLRGGLSCKPVANENDPALTESPSWGTKVQSAWVRRAAERRAGGAS